MLGSRHRFGAALGALLSLFIVVGAAPARAQKGAARRAPFVKSVKPVKSARQGVRPARARLAAAPVCPTQTQIMRGSDNSGTLAAGDCTLSNGAFADEYFFDGVAGRRVFISMVSEAFDTYLYLTTPSGTVLEDDNGGTEMDSRIPACCTFLTLPETGRYYILASSAAAGATGTYQIGLVVPQVADGDFVISEFRLRGPGGANDEFIEIYNALGEEHTVRSPTAAGYAVAASDGTVRFTIPNETLIPKGGRYLICNSVGYSLASYPAGSATTATCDATYTADIPDNAGLALFNNNIFLSPANRIDAVGSTAEANTLYKEGAGYPALGGTAYLAGINYSFYRDNCGKQGSITALGPCPSGGNVVDTDDNAADFIFVDTNGTSAGAGQRLGAPGPENLSSPVERNASFGIGLLDPCVAGSSPPNRVRDFTSDPANNSTFGTLDIRRTYTNSTGAPVTKLRFRIVDITTFPAPAGVADLRPRTSTAVVVTVDRAPCGSGTSNVTVQGTTLEQPPSQPNGGGFNSSLAVGTVALATPLANGATIDLRFLLGIQQNGGFKILVNVEALP